MLNGLVSTLGGIIVLVVAADIFRSLLVPRASTRVLRIGPLLSMALFGGWHAVADRTSSPRFGQTIRAYFAPLMLVLMMMIWASLLIFGFGLVFWADRANFVPQFADIGDAIYASGSAFSTLGINGHVVGNLTRLAVLICSVAGLAIVTVVATFLISIQNAVGHRETSVLRLESHISLPPAGIAILETYGREQITSQLSPFFERWEQWTAQVAISHRAFPILLFFRSNDSRCEWLAALGAVLDAATLVDAAIADVPPDILASAHFALLTGARMLASLASQVAANNQALEADVDIACFREYRERLVRAGYKVVVSEQIAFEKFVDRRNTYTVSLSALARRLHIDIDKHAANNENGARNQN